MKKELRNDYSLSKYSGKYEELYREEEIKDIQKKYPCRMLELTNQPLEILNNE